MADQAGQAAGSGDTTQTSAIGLVNQAAVRGQPLATQVVMAAVGELTALAKTASDAGDHEQAANLGGSIVSALQRLSQKPGWRTTEFYISLIAKVAGGYLIVSGDDTKAALGAGLIAVATLSYNLSRGQAKKLPAVAALLFALLLASGGCAPTGYIAVADVEPLVTRCLDRHDAYVKSGKKPDGTALSVDEQGTDLDSSAIVRKMLAQAKAAPGDAPQAAPKCPEDDDWSPAEVRAWLRDSRRRAFHTVTDER